MARPAPPPRPARPQLDRPKTTGSRTVDAPIDAPIDAPFALVAFCAAGLEGGALLATNGFSEPKLSLLARDLVHCLCADWSVAVRQIKFEWPMPGVPGSMQPALSAFLDKQLQDFAVTRALATASAARRLPPADIEFVPIPDLEELRDPDAKRALWRQMQSP